MKLKESPLKLDEFVVLQLEHKFIPPTKRVKNIQDIFSQYDIDIDFGLKEYNDIGFELRVKVSINRIEKPLVGYDIFIETAGIFRIEDEIEDEEFLHNLKLRSTLSMQLNFLRTSIANFSSYFPFGKYWLPSIDINSLIRDKQSQEIKSDKARKLKSNKS